MSPSQATGQGVIMRHNAFLSGFVTVAVLATLSFATAAASNPKSAPPPPAAAAPASSAPAPAPTPPDDPEKVDAARNFIIAFHTQLDPKNVAILIEKRLPFVVKQEKEDDPKVDVNAFEQQTRKRLMDSAMKSLDLQAHVVSRHFTLQELNDLTAFFRSPLGSKLASETHKITLEMLMEKRKANPKQMFPVKIK